MFQFSWNQYLVQIYGWLNCLDCSSAPGEHRATNAVVGLCNCVILSEFGEVFNQKIYKAASKDRIKISNFPLLLLLHLLNLDIWHNLGHRLLRSLY
jgi:hypothetical protein